MAVRRGNQKTSKRKIAQSEREAKALELRKAGYDLNYIARECGFKGRSGAYHAIKRAIERITTEPALEVRELELHRLDHLQRLCWDRVLDEGEIELVDKLLRIMDRRAKLLGLDSPVKVAPTNPAGDSPYSNLSDEDLLKMYRKLMSKIESEHGSS